VTLDDDSLNSHCISINEPWSIIDSSTSNSHLAAVLAGFMVTAIVFLLRDDDRAQAAKSHTIAMFYAGVGILGLCSYQFGSIGSISAPSKTVSDGEVVRSGAEHICAIVWTQGMAASGMLAVGGVLLIAGLGWTTTQFALNSESDSKFLACLGNLMTGVVVITVGSMLVITTHDYIHALASPPFLKSLLNWVPILVLMPIGAGVLCGILIVARTRKLSNRIKAKQPWPAENKVRNWSLIFAVGAAAALGLAGPLFDQLFPTEGGTPGTWPMIWAITLCLVWPCLISIAVAYGVPGPAFRWEERFVIAKSATTVKPGEDLSHNSNTTTVRDLLSDPGSHEAMDQ
jgi:hypothetical protein